MGNHKGQYRLYRKQGDREGRPYNDTMPVLPVIIVEATLAVALPNPTNAPYVNSIVPCGCPSVPPCKSINYHFKEHYTT